MGFLEILLSQGELFHIYLKPNHQNIKGTSPSSPKNLGEGVQQRELMYTVHLMVILGKWVYCLSLTCFSLQIDTGGVEYEYTLICHTVIG